MVHYEVLAVECGGGPDCPKVARDLAGMVAIVGPVITDPEALAALGVGFGEGAVQITEALYHAGYHVLAGQAT